MVSCQLQHVASNFAEDWERHDCLLVAVLEIIYVGILGCISVDGFLGQFVEYVLVDVAGSLHVLPFPAVVAEV